MARRGLVSKSAAPPPGGGAKPFPGQNQSPLGDKAGPRTNVLSLEQAAAKLEVVPAQVEQWIQEGLLRTAAGGIRPYDLNKFSLDCAEEIRAARRRPAPTAAAPAEVQEQESGRPPGLFQRIFSLLGSRSPEKGQAVAAQSSTVAPIQAAELSKLRSRLKEATSKIKSLEEQLARSQEGEPSDEAAERIRALEQQLAGREAQLRELEKSDHSEYEAQIQMLETRLAQADGLRNQMREAGDRIRELESQLAEAGDVQHLEHLEHELACARERIAELENQQPDTDSGGSQARILELEAEIEQARVNREQELQRVRAEVSRLQNEKEQRVQELESQLIGARQRMELLEARPPSAVSGDDYNALHQELEQAEAARRQLEQRCHDLENELVQARSLPSEGTRDLETRLHSLSAELEALRAERDRAIEGWQESDQMVRELEENYQQLHREATEISEYAQAAEVRLQEMDHALNERDQLIEELSHQGGGDTTALQASLEQAQKRISELDSQLQYTTNEARRHITDLRAQIQQKDQALAELRARLETPPALDETRVVELEQEVADLTAQLEARAAASQRVAELEHELALLRMEPPPAPSDDLPQRRELEDLLAQSRVELNSLRRSHDVIRLANHRLETQVQELTAALEEERSTPSAGRPLALSLPGQEPEPVPARLVALEREKMVLEQQLREAHDELRRLQSTRATAGDVEIAGQQIAHLQRTVSNRDAQVKKLAARQADLERALSKANQESTRLTELLIDRESKLKNVKRSMEEEAEERFQGLERQLTNLEWKLSVREDRIAALEDELARTRRVLPPPSPRSRD